MNAGSHQTHHGPTCRVGGGSLPCDKFPLPSLPLVASKPGDLSKACFRVGQGEIKLSFGGFHFGSGRINGCRGLEIQPLQRDRKIS